MNIELQDNQNEAQLFSELEKNYTTDQIERILDQVKVDRLDTKSRDEIQLNNFKEKKIEYSFHSKEALNSICDLAKSTQDLKGFFYSDLSQIGEAEYGD